MSTPPIPPIPGGIAAVRGAVSVSANSAAAIREATARLLQALLQANRIEPAQIVSALFTATPDLNADFPAHAARLLGWEDVPLLGAQEIAVPGMLPRIVRVLLTVRGVREGERLVPVYLDEAAALRPDLAQRSAPRPPGVTSTGPAAKRRLAIIGLGQIGGSIGLALATTGRWQRRGWDVDAPAARAALATGAIDEIAASLASACDGAELAVLATPVDTLAAIVDEAAGALPPGAALLDTGSARGPITPALAAAAARGIFAVGGHPLAGVAGHGFGAARADLFHGHAFALSPIGAEVPGIVTDLVMDLGARALRVEPAHHDAALARTSHLPYLIALALHDLGAAAEREGLSGPGFRDMTRLAASDPRVAEAYCRGNAGEVGMAWSELRARLDQAVAALRPTGLRE